MQDIYSKTEMIKNKAKYIAGLGLLTSIYIYIGDEIDHLDRDFNVGIVQLIQFT